ncbi:hypothetical protein AB2B38_012740 [Balneola sp. MJW-20]|uniref:hypothetical protein n=1 Tax=Gracilimonas aurantiaca TaxID=3234185 RepID=UPI0034653D46
MKKFITKVILFLVPVLVLSYPVDLMLSSFLSQQESVSFKGGEFSVWNDIFDNKIDSEVVVYGNSRAWVQFNPQIISDSTGYQAYNLGIDGHSFNIQYLRHKLFLKHNEKPEIILMSVDFSTFEKKPESYNYNYAQFLPYMLWNEDIKEYTQQFEGFDRIEYSIPLVRYFGEFTHFLKAVSVRLDEQSKSPREDGYKGIESEWNNDLKIAQRDQPKLNVAQDPKNIELFEKFLSECKEMNIEVVLVHAPMYNEAMEFIDNNDEILQIFTDIAERNDLVFLDYSDVDMNSNTNYFYNGTHLNAKGSNLFTSILMEDLKKSAALKNLASN